LASRYFRVEGKTTISSTGKYWPEDRLEKTETYNNIRVLMIVCYCCV